MRFSVASVMVGCVAMLAVRSADADCKLIVLMDRTGSMLSESTAFPGESKCRLSQDGLIVLLNHYNAAEEFDMMTGATFPIDYIAKCPTPATRLVQVWEFSASTDITPLWSGYKTVPDALIFLLGNPLMSPPVPGNGWYDPATGSGLGDCPGPDTPLAQAMCRVANHFPPGMPPGGDQWVVKTITDGLENSSQNVTPLEPGETQCRLPSDGVGSETWRSRVQSLYTGRGIQADTVLFGTGGATQLLPQSDEGALAFEAVPAGAASLHAAASGPPQTPDEIFFANLAQATHGRFQEVTTSVAPSVSKVDSDGDGIPDFRDACPQSSSCPGDSDGDGVLDVNDLCPTQREDGRGTKPNDGCADTDGDGVRNGLDACTALPEDGRPPFPSDGCPAAHWTGSATPNLATVDNDTACTSLTVSTRSDASLVQLNISGSHAFRSVLRGTLSHNNVMVAAFPVNTFPANSGAFSFTNRPIPGLSGDSLGTWTLCITDTDAFGDTGVLNSWSVHY